MISHSLEEKNLIFNDLNSVLTLERPHDEPGGSGFLSKLADDAIDKWLDNHINKLLKQPGELLNKDYKALFCTFFRLKPEELEKTIAQKNPEKSLLKLGYLLFCENFAYALRALDLSTVIFREEKDGNVILVSESKFSSKFSDLARKALEVMFKNKKNNMSKCRNNNLIVQVKRADGNIEYSFVHDKLIEHFYVRKSKELWMLQMTPAKPTTTTAIISSIQKTNPDLSSSTLSTTTTTCAETTSTSSLTLPQADELLLPLKTVSISEKIYQM